jgi:hypothetical protein
MTGELRAKLEHLDRAHLEQLLVVVDGLLDGIIDGTDVDGVDFLASPNIGLRELVDVVITRRAER